MPIDFLLHIFQPFYGGKKHHITAQVFDPGQKKPIVTIEGEWNGVMYAKHSSGVSSSSSKMFTSILLHMKTCISFS